jgi:prolyl oligopeptidase
MLRSLVAALLLCGATMSPAAPIAYPASPSGTVVDTQFGMPVADPYRWLEGDVRTEQPVADWVAAQNRVTQGQLATLPQRGAIKARLTQLFDYERVTLPLSRGGRLFFRRNSGLQNQSVLVVQDGVSESAGGAAPRVLIDPNGWAKDGATALAEWAPAPDGKRIAYAVQDGGSDWRVIKILDVATGTVLADELDWVKFSGIAWNADASGF